MSLHKKPSFYTLGEFMSRTDLEPPTPIIEGLLYREEFILLTARAKVGKSLLASNLALCVASGTPFLGTLPSKMGKVVIVQTEIAETHYRERIEKMLPRFPNYKDWEQNLIISSSKFRIDSDEEWRFHSEHWLKLEPDLIILDPFYTLHSKEENNSSEVAPLLRRFNELSREEGVSVLVIHHQGKSGEASNGQTGHRARGSSSFADVPDGSWSLQASGDSKATLHFEFRNRAATDQFRLHRDADTLTWAFEGRTSKKIEHSLLLRDIFQQVGDRISRSDLISSLEDLTGLKERRLADLLSGFVESGLLSKETEGTCAFFTPGPYLQNATPIGDCKNADSTHKKWDVANGL